VRETNTADTALTEGPGVCVGPVRDLRGASSTQSGTNYSTVRRERRH